MKNRNIKFITLVSSLVTSLILVSTLSTSIVSTNNKTIDTNTSCNTYAFIDANSMADASLFFEGEATGKIEYVINNNVEPHTLTIVSSYNLVATDPTFKSTITIDYQKYTLTEIGEDAFLSCSGLSGSLIFPESLKLIHNTAFFNCTNLTSIKFDNIKNSKLQSIGKGAFEYCSLLKEVNIPSSVQYIESWSFAECENLNNFNFNNIKQSKLITIGWGAFDYCTSLNSISIPSSVHNIDQLAFNSCTSLDSITLSWVEQISSLNLSENWLSGVPSSLVIYVPSDAMPLYMEYADLLGISNFAIEQTPKVQSIDSKLVTWLTLWVGIPTMAIIISGAGYYNSIRKYKK